MYKHGVYTSEVATSLVAPVLSTAGLQVIVGTAPVNMVADPEAAANTPIIAYSYKEAVEAVGYVADFEKYTLCEAISANFQVMGTGPIVMINVLDPSNSKFKVSLAGDTIDIEDGVAKVDEIGVLLSDLVVKKDAATTLTKDTDYTTSFNDDGTLNIVILDTAATSGISSVIVTGKKLDPTTVTASDIVGSVDASTGKETGLEVIRQVFPKLGLTPGIILAPRWSKEPTVGAAMQAKCVKLNGNFNATCIIDVDCSASGAKKYSDVNTVKTSQGITSENAYAVWPYAAIGDVIYSGSSLAGARVVLTDAENNDTPNVSPSNKTVAITKACLEDGTEVYLDQEQANTVNGYGVATWLNFNGFRLWGNNTAAYPGTTDPKDRWYAIRRFMSWAANTFILTYFQKVDDPLNPRLRDAIIDSENVRGNGFVARGICARYEIVYDSSENSSVDLMAGKVTFHQYMTPYGPAEDIENVIEYDANALG